MASCKETAQLISESLDRQLNFRERMSLRLHTLRCDVCARYAKQLKFLKTTFTNTEPEQTTTPACLDEAARKRIRDRLNQNH